MVLRAGQQVGSYRIISEIAHGEYAYVYKATHIVLTNRVVAFKLLRTTFQNAPDGKDLFFQEARILEHLKHPAILPVLDVNMHEDFPYIVKEFAAHGTLRDRMRHQRAQPITQEEALYLLQQIGDVLQYVHEQNVVHCDLKPENILFTAENELRLTDFDIARILHKNAAQAAGIGGSPSYMSPEQFQGKVRRESDQYALGCIAYELLTGQRPFAGRDFETLKNQQCTQEPQPLSTHNPDMPAYIEQAVLKALAKKYSDRHADVATFIQALQTKHTQADPTPYPATTQRHWSEQPQQHPQQHTPQLILKNNPRPTRIEDDIYYEPTVAMENEAQPEQARQKKVSATREPATQSRSTTRPRTTQTAEQSQQKTTTRPTRVSRTAETGRPTPAKTSTSGSTKKAATPAKKTKEVPASTVTKKEPPEQKPTKTSKNTRSDLESQQNALKKLIADGGQPQRTAKHP